MLSLSAVGLVVEFWTKSEIISFADEFYLTKVKDSKHNRCHYLTGYLTLLKYMYLDICRHYSKLFQRVDVRVSLARPRTNIY